MNYSREDACAAWLTYGRLPSEGLMRLWERFGCAEAIYEQFSEEPRFILEFGPRSCMSLLLEHGTQEAMHEMLLTMQKHNIGVLTVNSPLYPELLLEISDPPVILFYQGNVSCLIHRSITMVGSRSASPQGLAAAREVAGDLARKEIIVVSGFAQGVDRASHEGCLDAGGQTIAVMACGLDITYPSDSAPLRERMLKSGSLLISEYPPGVNVQRYHFAVRNRILSGMSAATIMMECQPKSGSMLTVQHALDQGREVFAYPGQAGTPAAAGSHMLLREGATYFAFAEDVMLDLGWIKPQLYRAKHVDPAPVSSPTVAPLPELATLTSEQLQILRALSGGECSFDQLADLTGLDAPSLSGALTMLQLLGHIQAMPGKMYARV